MRKTQLVEISVPCGALVALALTTCSPSVTHVPPPEVVLDIPPVSSGAAAPSASPSPGGVRFHRVPPAVGARWTVEVQAVSSWNDAQHGLLTTIYESTYDVEVLEMSGPAPSRVRIAFSRNWNTDANGTVNTSIHGKTFVVDSGHVLLDAGGLAPVDEATRVTDVLADLGTRTQIDQILPDGEMQIGEARHDLAAAVVRILHPRYWSLQKGSAVLARASDTRATFAIELTATSTASGSKIALAGELHVRLRDTRLEGFRLKGTFSRSAGDDGEMVVERAVRDAPH